MKISPFFVKTVNKYFKIEKELYPFIGVLPITFLSAPIYAFKWQKFFAGVTDIRIDVVTLLYKGYIYDEENYTVVKQECILGPFCAIVQGLSMSS